jgi:hypothetical protein
MGFDTPRPEFLRRVHSRGHQTQEALARTGVAQLTTRRTEMGMDEALWCVTYGVMW